MSLGRLVIDQLPQFIGKDNTSVSLAKGPVGLKTQFRLCQGEAWHLRPQVTPLSPYKAMSNMAYYSTGTLRLSRIQLLVFREIGNGTQCDR